MTEEPTAPGFYFVGHVTEESRKTMSPKQREKWPVGMAMSNTTPFKKRSTALASAVAHSLRDITVIQQE